MKRDPTNVELFDIAQSNSEHSRHWFFRGNLFREDGTQYPKASNDEDGLVLLYQRMPLHERGCRDHPNTVMAVTRTPLVFLVAMRTQYCRAHPTQCYPVSCNNLQKLFDIVKAPWKANPNNSVVAFKDNSSTIRGFKAAPIVPAEPGTTSRMELQARLLM